ncbi:hypothetical protein MMC24_007702 [Lignoscripta atroalba]|nr:hypothetical protein [Lignoscripta atroalba]
MSFANPLNDYQRRFLSQAHHEFSYFPKASSTTLAYGVLSVVLVYHILHIWDYPLLSIPELLWNCLVYVTPGPAVSLLDRKSRVERTEGPEHKEGSSRSQTFAAKSEAMRRILGLDSTGILMNIQRARSLSGIGTVFRSAPGGSLPGLGNWDNSCYQNSVIQGLASLPSMSKFLDQAITCNATKESRATQEALKDIIEKLNNPLNAGQRLWTPSELKSMSSWQQQDAQEYYSKILNEVEREMTKIYKDRPLHIGLAEVKHLDLDSISERPDTRVDVSKAHKVVLKSTTENPGNSNQLPDELTSIFLRNPLEGLLAQRVGCLQCGYVEGLSLIPFNCLTLPLGKQWTYDVRTCLEDYTTLEPINGVDCSKCTLLRHKQQLQQLVDTSHQLPGIDSVSVLPLSEALRSSAQVRLKAVDTALEEGDFSENTLLKRCHIPTKSRVSATKSRQAVVARAPQSLVLHLNRSVFDEFSGLQSKNYADVRFPKELDLAPWCLGMMPSADGQEVLEHWNVDPASSMLPDDELELSRKLPSHIKNMYTLRAVITHYGRHENGHYICYRMNPQPSETYGRPSSNETWWRLSDDDVSEVSEEHVLEQGGVFMLFYERIQELHVVKDHVSSSLAERNVATLDLRVEELVDNQLSLDIEVKNNNLPADEAPADKTTLPVDLGIPSPNEEPPPPSTNPSTHPLMDDRTRTAIKPIVSNGTDKFTDANARDFASAAPEIETTLDDPVSNNKENRPISLPMRTAGPGPSRGRGSIGRAQKSMAPVSSMVTAN